MTTTAATIVTTLKTGWDDATYPITGRNVDWSSNYKECEGWNFVERVNVDYATSNSKKAQTFRIWLRNKVEASIDHLVGLLQGISAAVVFVNKLAQYFDTDGYYQAVVDVDVID